MIKGPQCWKEREFEEWFLLNPILPPNETVIVVDRGEPGERVSDLLAIDSSANLITIEVKNENTTRTAIGQSLEYLSQLANINLEDIETNYIDRKKQPLAEKFMAVFGKQLKNINQRKIVYLIAPSFDTASIVCAQYLSNQLRGPIEFRLLEAKRLDDNPFPRFVLAPPPSVGFVHTSKLSHGFAKSLSGSLFYVVQPGIRPVLWKIGKHRSPGEVIPLNPGALKKSLSTRRRWLIPMTSEDIKGTVNVSLTGTCWKKKGAPDKLAKLIGVITENGVQKAILVRMQKAKQQIQVKPKSFRDLQNEWEQTNQSVLPGWRTLAERLAR